MFWKIVVGISALKLLFYPSYKSTDFEVHRNWLAITHELPLSQWYTDTTSPWTLDYPPFFAYFEFVLSQFAVLMDKNMVKVSNLNYDSFETLVFQRVSVIITDIVLAFGIKSCFPIIPKNTRLMTSLLILSNAGLLLVDHIHFQYNGFLFGILFLSLSALLTQRYLLSSLWFAVLLNFKHIFLYMVPAYVVYLFKVYCCYPTFSLSKFLKLSCLVSSVTLLSFGPFLSQIPEVLLRLFPFKRGLVHAYWAPNFWVIYNVMDKGLSKLLQLQVETGTMTSGLVQEYHHRVLPTITPALCFLLSAFSMVPILRKLWMSPNNCPTSFLTALILIAWNSFMLGWHVHEKAILLILLPFTLLSALSSKIHRLYWLASFFGHFSLFPLIFRFNELFVKLNLFLFHGALSYIFISKSHTNLYFFEKMYVGLCGCVFIFEYLHPGFESFPFLPLLLYSLYSSIGLIYTWISLYVAFLSQDI